MTRLSTTARIGLVGVTAMVALIVPGSASGASRELDYSCDYSVGDLKGVGPATASYDSGIGEGVVIDLGQTISLDPFSGTITIPDEFTTQLRRAGISAVHGDGLQFTLFPEDGTYESPRTVEIEFGTTDVPAEGPLTLHVEGVAGSATPDYPGTKTWFADSFVLNVHAASDAPSAGLTCGLVDPGDISIASFEVVAPATPTPTPTVSQPAPPAAAPVRPVVVHTDFAGEDDSMALPLVLGGGLLAAGTGALASGRVRARAASRRH
jgi:hypothetical protein